MSQLTFLQVCRLVILPPSQTAFSTHRGLWGGGGKKPKTYGSECKTAFGRLLKPTIYIYTDMHILPSVYIVMCSPCLFPLYIFQFFSRRLRNQSETVYCKTKVSKINTSTVQSLDTFSVIQNLHKPKQVSSLIRVSNTGKCMKPTA